MLIDSRSYSSGTGYRYGFNGKYKDNEISGNGNQYDYGFRIYNPRLGKFLSVDPLTKSYPELTPYQYASNTPIQAIDIDGLEGGRNTILVTPPEGGALSSTAGGQYSSTNEFALIEAEATIPSRIIKPEPAGTYSTSTTQSNTSTNTANTPGNVNNAPAPSAGSTSVQTVNTSTTSSVPTRASTTSSGNINQEAIQRGRINEQKTIEEEGLTKNNNTANYRDPKTGKNVGTKVDTKQETFNAEIKDVKYLSNTAQIRTQRMEAKMEGKDYKIYTGTNTTVSKNIPETEIIRVPYLGPQTPIMGQSTFSPQIF